ncbi:hypothetical protein N7467_008184 [Penicillium canescens]|nr:hypothetical protein N7467_008184 [Penicillium canescens]
MVGSFPIFFEPGMEDLFKQEDSARQYVSSLADLAVTPSVGQTADIAASSETATMENALPNSVPLASSQPFSPDEPYSSRAYKYIMGNINFNYISANDFNDFNNFIFDLYRTFYIDIINHRRVLHHDFFSVRTNNRTDKIKLSNN